jgi:hypothetical protein
VLRSSAIGTGVGLLPGLGGSVSQWIAYAHAAKRSPNPGEFGRGAIEGVIAPSAANNATLGGALVPTLALGIPGSLSTAMLLSALIVKGLVPGPQMLVPERDGGHLGFVFALAWMIVVANLLATAASWSASGLLVRITRVRSAVLVPILLLLVFVGAFTERHQIADLVITLMMGAAGLAFAHFRWPRAPVLIGLVLGRLAENRLFLSIDAYGALWLLRPGVLLAFAVIAASWAYPYLARRARAHSDVNVPSDPLHGATVAERVLIVVLLGACLGALAATAGFAPRSALFPRLALIATVVLLTAVLAHASRRAGEATVATLGRDRLPLQTVGFVPLYVLLIWALGFTLGAPAAVLMYLVIGGRERMGTVLAVTLAASLLIEIVMVRLLLVPFPAGAVLAWAGVGSAR